MKSIYKNLGGVIQLPEYQGRLLYMHKMHMSDISLPRDFQDYEASIDQILSKIADRNNVCYITIDEKEICSGTHRRPGKHVDFNWYENLNAHGGGGGGHWNKIAHGRHDLGGHGYKGGHDRGDGVIIVDNIEPLGGMLLVSNYQGCRVWGGEFEGEIGEGGCCKDIDTDHLESEIMQPSDVYYVNALGIHESVLIQTTVKRNLVRINFHPEYKFEL